MKKKPFIPSPKQAENYRKATLAKYVKRLTKKLNAELIQFEKSGKTISGQYSKVVNELQSLNNATGKKGKKNRASAAVNDVNAMKKLLEIIYNYYKQEAYTPVKNIEVYDEKGNVRFEVIREITENELKLIVDDFFSIFGSRDGEALPYELIDNGMIIRNEKGQFIPNTAEYNRTQIANELAYYLHGFLGVETPENTENFMAEFTLTDEIHNAIQSKLYGDFNVLLEDF